MDFTMRERVEEMAREYRRTVPQVGNPAYEEGLALRAAALALEEAAQGFPTHGCSGSEQGCKVCLWGKQIAALSATLSTGGDL